MMTSFLFSYIVGVFFAPLFHISNAVAFLFIVIATAVGSYGVFFVQESGVVRPRRTVTTAIGLVAVAIGILYFNYVSRPLGVAYIDAYVNQKVALCGRVVDEPERKDAETKAVLALTSCDTGVRADRTKILLHDSLWSTLQYGDLVRTEGKLLLPQNFASSTFDYVAYLAKDGIAYEMRFASTTVLATDQGAWLVMFLYRVKHAAIRVMQAILPEPHASLSAGLLLGARDSLGQEWLDIFRAVGIVHIIVLSGYNITVVARAAMAGLSSLSRMMRFGVGSLVIVLFSLLAGGGATVWRAAAMAAIALFARESYRNFHAGRALLLAGFVMTIFNPKLPFHDASFQLSFVATLGLIYLSPIVEIWRWIGAVPARFGLREVAVSTFSTQIAVLPLILHLSGMLSVIGPLVNLLVLPFVPVTMFFSFFATALGFISWIFALPMTAVAYTLLSYVFAVSRFAAHLPFASVNVSLPGWATLALYVLLVSCVARWHQRHVKLEIMAQADGRASFPGEGTARKTGPHKGQLTADDFDII